MGNTKKTKPTTFVTGCHSGSPAVTLNEGTNALQSIAAGNLRFQQSEKTAVFCKQKHPWGLPYDCGLFTLSFTIILPSFYGDFNNHHKKVVSNGWFQIFFIFTRIWGNDPF